MNNVTSSTETRLGSGRLYRTARIVLPIVSLIINLTIALLIVQAIATGSPLPIWVIFITVGLIAGVVGLAVAFATYKAVNRVFGEEGYRAAGRIRGQVVTEAKSIEAGEATSLRAEIDMAGGVLHIGDGSARAMDATLTYDDGEWQPPQAIYAVDANGRGELIVKSKGGPRHSALVTRNEWDVRLNDRLPTDLNVRFGAGQADLKLGGLSLTALKVTSGVGAMSIDLSGAWSRSVSGHVQGGIGDVTIRLPQDIGVRVETAVFGKVQAGALTWNGDAYVNAAYGQSPVTLDLRVESGMGQIVLE
jgi:predicted membrane protein